MPPRNHIVWVPSNSDDDPVEYSDDSTDNEEARHVPPPDNPGTSQSNHGCRVGGSAVVIITQPFCGSGGYNHWPSQYPGGYTH